MTFEKLGLSQELLRAINDKGFTKPSEIQERSIPIVLKGKDVLAGSKTGSGKTLAFGSVIIEKAIPEKGIQALVLCPTRELATQVAGEIRSFAKYKRLKVVSVYGGIAINPQIDRLQSAEVVVGTPGRVLDHMSRKTIDLSKVLVLVLDEADIMFDMGFIEDVERIIKATPKVRQTLLFSATITGPVQKLTKNHMVDPVKINAVSYVDPSKLNQSYFSVKDHEKFSMLVHLLKKGTPGLVMIFTNTRSNTDFIADNLHKMGIDAVGIHGGLTQARREEIMERFNDGTKQHILVCTDVAARGLDIDDVSQVYNYDTPSDPRQYIHRIGRTARAGKTGEAITILSPRDHDSFRKVLWENQLKVERKEVPKFERLKMDTARREDFRRPQNRFSGKGRFPKKRGSSPRRT